MPKKLKFFITSLEKYIRQIKLDFFLMNLKLNITLILISPRPIVASYDQASFFVKSEINI